MSLREEVRGLTGKKRKFFLLRIAGVDTDVSKKLCNVPQGTYNSWLQNEEFTLLYRRRDEFAVEYRQEALQLLRRDNQLEAIMLESELISKMRKELDTGEYNLIRSQLAREVYSKLIADLDVVPKTQMLTWEERIANIIIAPQEQLPETIEGQFKEVEPKELENSPSG